MLTASGTYAVLLACVCMCVHVHVSVVVHMYTILIGDYYKRKNVPDW